jgi:hypothetical protein
VRGNPRHVFERLDALSGDALNRGLLVCRHREVLGERPEGLALLLRAQLPHAFERGGHARCAPRR